MPIIVNLDVMMAKRHMGAGELAETIGITPANLSILKNNKAKAVRFSTLEALCKALDCQPADLLDTAGRNVKKRPWAIPHNSRLAAKHRSGSCGTASALPKCSIMSGCSTRVVSGAKAPRTLRPLSLLRFAVSATGGAHLCSIQYYLRFWLGICRTSLAVSALRIMRYCP